MDMSLGIHSNLLKVQSRHENAIEREDLFSLYLYSQRKKTTMIRADLYEKDIPLESYVSTNDCRACGFHNREDFLEKLRSGSLKPSQCKTAQVRIRTLLWAARPSEILPEVEVLQLPNPGPAGLFPVNQPEGKSPVLVSGNSQLTVEVLTSVLSTTLSPFWYLVVDTDGHTVDMALVYKVMTADRILNALHHEDMDAKAPNSPLYLPGLAAPLCNELSKHSCRSVFPGPVCAAELPLFFGEDKWRISDGIL